MSFFAFGLAVAALLCSFAFLARAKARRRAGEDSSAENVRARHRAERGVHFALAASIVVVSGSVVVGRALQTDPLVEDLQDFCRFVEEEQRETGQPGITDAARRMVDKPASADFLTLMREVIGAAPGEGYARMQRAAEERGSTFRCPALAGH